MSILIKGIGVPENCWDCPLQYDYMCCSVMDEIKLTDENEEKRDSSCPLEEVPETHDKRTETHACDLIDRQDAIRIVDGIDTWQAGWRGNAIESLKAMPSAQPEPHWIPCSERLPEERQEILATTTDNAWGDVVIIRTYYKEMHKSVIAWMPLPEPYRAERRTDEAR